MTMLGTCMNHFSAKGFIFFKEKMRSISPKDTAIKPRLKKKKAKKKTQNKAKTRLFLRGLRCNPSSGSRRKPPPKSPPFFWVTSEVSHGKKAKVTAGVQASGSPDYDACGFILRQHGNSGAEWPQLRAAEDCLRGACVALFLLLSIWKESASEMTKNRKTKIHTKEKKRPLAKAQSHTRS